MRINNNLMALNTYRQLGANQAAGAKSLERLSSGFRINRAGDDAAGLAISEKMRGQIRGLTQASRNAQDAISMIQTAEGALAETHSVLQRMRELTIQAANDTYNTSDREEIQREIDQLTSEINRIANTTQFNNKKLLNGEASIIAAVTAKLTGGEVAANFTNGLAVIDAPTSATATGEVLSGTVELLAETGSTVTGTETYATAVGPNTESTSATITGSTLTGNITFNDGGGKVITGTAVYATPAAVNSGPNVERTDAVATGGTSIITNDNLIISDVAGATLTGTVAYATPAANDSGPNVTAADNELTVTLNGVTKHVVLTINDYSGGGDDSAADFAADVQTQLNDVANFGAGAFSVGFDAQNRIVITSLNSVDDEVSITGAGSLDHFLTTPATEDFTAGTQEINNTLTLSVTFDDGDGTSTDHLNQTLTLTNGAYDLTDAGGRAALLADINAQLDASTLGAGEVVASFVDGKLTLTNSKAASDGALNTIELDTDPANSTALATLGLEDAVIVNGTENNELIVSLDGGKTTATIWIDTDDYSTGDDDGADDFAADIQTKLQAIAGGDYAAIEVSVNADGKIEFNTKDAAVELTIVGGGLETLLKAAPADEYVESTETVANNQLTLTANSITRTITLSDATYANVDQTGAGQDNFLADVQAQLDTAFGAGLITASFDGGLVLTNNTDGTASTFGTSVTGNAAATVGLDAATVEQGGEFNNLTITYEGTTQTLELAEVNYDGTAGKTTTEFLADIQAKLDAAFNPGDITVSLDNNDRIMFTTKAAGEEISIDGGGAVNHLLATGDTIDDLVVDLSGDGNNTMTLTVGNVTKDIEIIAGNYDLTDAGDKATIVADMNTKLDAAFGAGNVVASFNGDNQMVLTSTVEGSISTIGAEFTGGAAEAFGLDTAIVVNGLDDNNTTTLTIDGINVEITLAAGTYNAGGMASELQSQIRAADPALAEATVAYEDGQFVITSGAEGSDGSVAASDDVLGRALGLTASAGAEVVTGSAQSNQAMKMQIGSNSFESISIDIGDMTGRGLGISSVTGGVAMEGFEAPNDSAQAVFRATKTINDGTNATTIEYSLDVLSHENATAAISVIDDAISTVSGERSKLGAFQNRLEHTISNLGTSAENLQSAESRIRDLDMALEMMAFTRNNILQQAAISMLAQANQAPQGILQLLR